MPHARNNFVWQTSILLIMRVRFHAVCALVTAITFTSITLKADDHVVPIAELQREVAAVSAARAQNLADIQRVLALPIAQAELQRANLNPERVKSAVSQLTSEELARL